MPRSLVGLIFSPPPPSQSVVLESHVTTGGLTERCFLFDSGNIMTEYNYPECTTSVLSALEMFTKRYPEYRADEIRSVSPPPSPSFSPPLPLEVVRLVERMLRPAFLFFGRVSSEQRSGVQSSTSMLRSGKTAVGTDRGASVSPVRSLLFLTVSAHPG